jgi:hypothetical protein
MHMLPAVKWHFNIAIYDRATALGKSNIRGGVISMGYEQTTPVLPPQVVLAMLPEGGAAGAVVGVMVVGVGPEVVPVDGVRVAVLPEERWRLNNSAECSDVQQKKQRSERRQEWPCFCSWDAVTVAEAVLQRHMLSIFLLSPVPPVNCHCCRWNHWCHPPVPPVNCHCCRWNHWCQ